MQFPSLQYCTVCGTGYLPNDAAYAFFEEEELYNIFKDSKSQGKEAHLRCLDERYLSDSAQQELRNGLEFCKKCGHSSFSIALGRNYAEAVVNREGYKNILANEKMPDLARNTGVLL